MEVKRVDPRTVTLAEYEVSYRVYFWDPDRGSDEFTVTKAHDVSEVLKWAEESARGRSFEVFADIGPAGACVRLLGAEPSEPY